jgi:hypothetical protein
MDELNISFKIWNGQKIKKEELKTTLKEELSLTNEKAIEYQQNFDSYIKNIIKDGSFIKKEIKNKIMEGLNDEII